MATVDRGAFVGGFRYLPAELQRKRAELTAEKYTLLETLPACDHLDAHLEALGLVTLKLTVIDSILDTGGNDE